MDEADYQDKLISSIRKIGDGESEDEILSLEDLVKIVVFQIDNQEFAMNVSETESISRLPNVTRVPSSPDSVRGIINLRGKTVLVLKLSYLLGLKELPDSKKTRIIIFDINEENVALYVDSIVQILTVRKSLIKPPTDIGNSKIDVDLIFGGLILDDRIITVLDPKKVFASKKLFETKKSDIGHVETIEES